MMKRTLAVVFLVVGCASQAPQREAAQLLTVQTTTLQRELAAFTDRRSAIDKERLRNTYELLESALETEGFNARTVYSLSPERKKLFDTNLDATAASLARARSADAALKERRADIETTFSRVAKRSDELTAATKALSRLAGNDKFVDALKFYRDFASEVRTAADAARTDAEKHETDAAQTSATLVVTQQNTANNLPGTKQ